MELDLADEQACPTEQQEVFAGPLTERLVHKNFKARKGAYEELQQLYAAGTPPLEDPSPFFKKMGAEANVLAQEAALEFFLAYFDKAEGAAQHAATVLPAVLDKCLGANKSSLAKKAQDLFQLAMEIDTPEFAVLELLKAFKHKTPKVRLAAAQCVAEAVRNFGVRVPIKEVLKKDGLLVLFGDSDGKVRKEAQTLALEVYLHVRDALKQAPFFAELRDAQRAELEKLFADAPADRPPRGGVRGLRSDATTPVADLAGKGADRGRGDLDDLVEAQPVLSKLPKNFFDVATGDGKWVERKEVLEVLANATNGKRLQPDDYLEVVKVLKRLLSDSNIPLVALAIKILGYFATGLGSNFGSYTRFYFPTLLDKYKEKKVTVLEPLHATLDLLHIHGCIVLPDFVEDLIAAATNKVPAVREYTLKWLAKCFNRSDKAAFQKAFKPLAATIGKLCNDSEAVVRDAALRILAAAQLSLGEPAVAPYLGKLDKKLLDKFRGFLKDVPSSSGASVSSSTTPSTSGGEPVRETPRALRKCDSAKRIHESPSQSSEDGQPPFKRAASSGPPIVAKTKKAGPGGSARDLRAAKGPAKAEKEEDFTAETMSDAEIEAAVQEFLPAALLPQLQSSAFKERVEAMDVVAKAVEAMADAELQGRAELLVRFLRLRPGWKEANFQVLNKVLQTLTCIAKRAKSFSKRCVWLCLPLVVDKVSDAKQKALCWACLTQFAEAVGPRFVADQLMKAVADCKTPRTVCEVLEWLAEAVDDFGASALDVKAMVAFVKDSFEKPNPNIKASGIKTLVALRKAMGPRVRDMVADVKPQLLTTIDEHFARVEDTPTAAPRRQARGGDSGGVAATQPAAMQPRTDISGQLTAALLGQVGHADWKARQTALTQVEGIVERAQRRIAPTVGPLLAACRARLADSNKNITVQSLNLIGLLALSMGPAMKGHLKAVADAVFHCLSETKPNVRQAAQGCLSLVEAETGLEALVPFLPKAFEILAARADLTEWLAGVLVAKGATLVPGCLAPVIGPVIACLQDRAPEVRKNAEAILGPLLANVGLDAFTKQTRDLKPAVAKTINAVLARQRGTPGFPVRETPTLAAQEGKENDVSRVNVIAPPQEFAVLLDSEKLAFKPRTETLCVDAVVPPRLSPATVDADPVSNVASPLAPASGRLSPIGPPSPRPTDDPAACPMAMDLPRPFARPPAEPPAPMPMEVEPPARRMDLQLEASFAPASRPAGPLMPSGPARVPIPMTECKSTSAVSRTEHSAAAAPSGSSGNPDPLRQLLDRIHTGNTAQCIDALKALLDTYINAAGPVRYNVDQVLEILLHRLAQAFDTDPLPVREAKFLLTALQGVFGNPEAAGRVSRDVWGYSIQVALAQLRRDELRQVQGGEFLLKAINAVVLKMLENCDKTINFTTLVEQLTEAHQQWRAHRSDKNHRTLELLVKCVLKCVSCILACPIEQVDMRALVKAIDTFLTRHPPSSFQPSDDMPLRTLKTALNEFTKACGPSIKAVLAADCSPLTVSTIDNCLARLGHAVAPRPGPPPLPLAPRPPAAAPAALAPLPMECAGGAAISPRPLSPAILPAALSYAPPAQFARDSSSNASSRGTTPRGNDNDGGESALPSLPPPPAAAAAAFLAPLPLPLPVALTAPTPEAAPALPMAALLDDLFDRIRNKDHTLQGIEELHQLVTAHPNLDIEPWLSKTSSPFQAYIKWQLLSLQAKKEAQAGQPPAAPAPLSLAASRLAPPAMTLEALRARMQAAGQAAAGPPAAPPKPLSPVVGRDVGAQFDDIRQRMQDLLQGAAHAAAASAVPATTVPTPASSFSAFH